MRGWARRHSLWILPFGTTCCAADLTTAFGPAHDLGRLGAVLVHDAALADILIVAGRVTRALAPDLRRLYNSMYAPKAVIAFGTCACTGGAWVGEEVPGGADLVVPVDAYIPGCPPPPESLYNALARVAARLA
ncbi:MAG: NADH-quinone oxidoreductase subunit NuoB [bacterium]|nr:NADH-quinone oxidoreductase subunit NuoB [bacterium]